MIVGHIDPAFSVVGRLLERYVGSNNSLGGAVCVIHRGETVVDAWGGASDHLGTPWQAETMSMSFSTTKGVVSTALHILADRGQLDYEAPVAEYWPEFAQSGKGGLKVRHVMTHMAGLHKLRGLVDDPSRMFDWDYMVGLLEAQPCEPAFGTRPGYHGITYGWLAGELVRRISGQSIGQFVQSEIATPLGLDGLFIGVPENEMSRVATLGPTPSAKVKSRTERIVKRLSKIRFTRSLVDALFVDGLDDLIFDPEKRIVRAQVPAMNGTFTARSLATMYACLASQGELASIRLVSPERVKAMSTIQVRMRDYCIGIDMRWRLGYHQAFTTGRMPSRGFGHFGYGGSGAWADPNHDLAVAFVTNDMRKATTPFADIRMARIGAAALAAARRHS